MRASHAIWAGFIMTIIGCSDISKVDTGQLDVSPAELLFPVPDPGSDSRRLAIEVTNVGRGPVVIASVNLTENDQNKELALVDSDDWQQARTLEPDSTERVFVEWVATDAQADEGQLTIIHNAGAPLLVPIRTTDIDPCIRVTTNPDGVAGDGDRVRPGGHRAGRRGGRVRSLQ